MRHQSINTNLESLAKSCEVLALYRKRASFEGDDGSRALWHAFGKADVYLDLGGLQRGGLVQPFALSSTRCYSTIPWQVKSLSLLFK